MVVPPSIEIPDIPARKLVKDWKVSMTPMVR